MLKIKRAYDKPESTDGRRVLIDRLWPRGLSKAKAKIDEWLKDLGPSTELRKWFGHDPGKWEEFRQKYLQELSGPGKTALLEKIARMAEQTDVTLVYSARDTPHSDVKVVEELVMSMMRQAQA
ncbi:MAG: DUF488 family protein [Dehalococcoidales bacterium]|nr:DUF488 family protein [Dehalococcoidales bacterium]